MQGAREAAGLGGMMGAASRSGVGSRCLSSQGRGDTCTQLTPPFFDPPPALFASSSSRVPSGNDDDDQAAPLTHSLPSSRRFRAIPNPTGAAERC